MRIRQADLLEFEVDHDQDTFVVNLETKVCGCYKWSLMGIPCCHALACIQTKRLNYEDFIHHAYHIQTYAKSYDPPFKGMLGQNQWDQIPYPGPLPPPYRKMPGRPSKHKRKKGAGENEDKQHVKRAKRQNKCSRCGGLGHYKPKCPMPAPPTETVATSTSAAVQNVDGQVATQEPMVVQSSPNAPAVNPSQQQD
ncbi:uncharacterized protein [Spinacia oleracea]|uniref:SWIM-type domain-containing protein n=1 Tax=Spinacia oleracea TaxID=3562 RepID=A0A9R0K933_SPIOL|nr:uncharacterized protein LOC110801891 [Spinacia oleracea]